MLSRPFHRFLCLGLALSVGIITTRQALGWYPCGWSCCPTVVPCGATVVPGYYNYDSWYCPPVCGSVVPGGGTVVPNGQGGTVVPSGSEGTVVPRRRIGTVPRPAVVVTKSIETHASRPRVTSVNRPAELQISLPEDVKIYVNGRPTKTTGTVRHYVARQLRPHVDHVYRIEARAVRDGVAVTKSRLISLRAGTTATLKFSFPNEPAAELANSDRLNTKG